MRKFITHVTCALFLVIMAGTTRSYADPLTASAIDPSIPISAISPAPAGSPTLGSLTGLLGGFYGASPIGTPLTTPSVMCSGNSGFGNASTYGTFCINGQSNSNAETYLVQASILDSSPQGNTSSGGVRDVVAGYFGVTNQAFTTGEWAVNALANDNVDGGGYSSGVVEIDGNNFSCDNSDADGNYVTLTSSVKKTRSDGSACPGHTGLGITGLAGYTSGAALAISGVPNNRANWEDGITMIGGDVIGSAEIHTNTLARNNVLWGGVHSIGLNALSASYNYAAIYLPLNNVSGRIIWGCPTTGGCVGYDSNTPSIEPMPDGTLTASAASFKASNNLVVTQTAFVDSISPNNSDVVQINSRANFARMGLVAANKLNCSVGDMLFVFDGRNQGETSGNGTGVLAYCNTKGVWYSGGSPVVN